MATTSHVLRTWRAFALQVQYVRVKRERLGEPQVDYWRSATMDLLRCADLAVGQNMGCSTREIERNKCDSGCFPSIGMATWRSELEHCEHG